MFRLIKLAAYALLGYALYEFFIGLTGSSENRKGPGQLSDRSSSSARPMTGSSGEGMPVRTQSADGGSAGHVVGRGVVGR